MSTTIPATGDFSAGNRPTLTVSGGRAGVHLILREGDDESSRSIMAWFDADALGEAIEAAKS